ncbi:sulfur oxidation c-type cytochrome SoxX [Pelagibius sp. Alg239-R121]|uniref:sulfur oxidation c-type cytochrome SoxX n=1 Tax=Pelagibius sp. Alg239-R121 TaxID=2993448 RepID=UPI0024A6ECA0|nr:sulfur oxidation c-type cytochrome SoxX [Pelagibius sp. Alg239-R121]
MQSRHTTGLKLFASLGALAVSIGFAAGAVAAPIAPQDVKIVDHKIDASLTGAAGNVEAGKKWFKGRKAGNCLACHENSDMASEAFHGEIGPSLDGVAGRYSEGQLRAILVNSKAVFGGETIMPSFYRANFGHRIAKSFKDKTILSAEQVEDVVAYLKTLGE